MPATDLFRIESHKPLRYSRLRDDLAKHRHHFPEVLGGENRVEHFPLLTMLVACVQGIRIQNADLLINAQKNIVHTCSGQETGPVGDHVHPNNRASVTRDA